MSESCEICRLHADCQMQRVYECSRDERWVVRHHADPAPLLGWMFLSAVRHVQGPADLNDVEAEQLGPMLRTVSRLVRSLTGCDRVYAIAFGQGAPHLHVHLIPRFDSDPNTHAWSVADHYRAVHAGERAPADASRVRQFVERMRQELRD